MDVDCKKDKVSSRVLRLNSPRENKPVTLKRIQEILNRVIFLQFKIGHT